MERRPLVSTASALALAGRTSPSKFAPHPRLNIAHVDEHTECHSSERMHENVHTHALMMIVRTCLVVGCLKRVKANCNLCLCLSNRIIAGDLHTMESTDTSSNELIGGGYLKQIRIKRTGNC